jgi:hypothetical protein
MSLFAEYCRYKHVDKDETGQRVVTFGMNGGIYTGTPIDHLFVANPGGNISKKKTVLCFHHVFVFLHAWFPYCFCVFFMRLFVL